MSAARRRAHVNILDPGRATWHRGCVGAVNRQDQAVMKPGRKSFGRVRVDALDAWMMVTTKAGWKTAVGFLITLKKHENDSGPLTVSVLFRARRHSREISQDLRSRMNLSSSVMAASTHTSFPRVRVNISATVEESMHRGRISAPWRRRQLVDGLRNHHDRDVHHSEHVIVLGGRRCITTVTFTHSENFQLFAQSIVYKTERGIEAFNTHTHPASDLISTKLILYSVRVGVVQFVKKSDGSVKTDCGATDATGTFTT